MGVAVLGTACSGGSSSEGGRSTVKVTEPERIDPPSLAGAEAPPPSDYVFDTVITGGRVMDPASGYDQVANVGIIGERIALISTDPLTGKATVDATGKVVAPGFIDVLSYEPNSYGVWYKLGDGVTTNLGMHGIKTPVDASQFFSPYTGANTPPLHYGGAFSDQWYRDSVGIKSTASASQISRLADDLERPARRGLHRPRRRPRVRPVHHLRRVRRARHRRPAGRHAAVHPHPVLVAHRRARRRSTPSTRS